MIYRLKNLLLLYFMSWFITGCGISTIEKAHQEFPFKAFIAEGIEGDGINYIRLPVPGNYKEYDFSPLPHNDENPNRKYVVKLLFDHPETEDLALFLPALFYPLDLFLNGEKIYRSGLKETGKSYSNFYGDMVQIPQILLKKKSVNEIAIRIYSGYEKRTIKNCFLGSYEEVKVYAFWYGLFHCTSTAVFSSLSLIYFLIFFALWLSGRYQTRTYLNFSFICLSLAFAYPNMIFSGIDVNELFLTKISRASYSLAAIFLFIFTMEYTSKLKKRVLSDIVVVISVPVILLLFIFLPETRGDVKKLFDVSLLCIVTPSLLISPILLTVFWLKTRRPGAFIIMLSIYAPVFAALRDVVYRKQYIEAYMWLLPVGYLIVEFGISIILALEQAYMTKKIAEQSRELKIANKELLQAKIIAERASKAKTGFLAKMAHEFRTPLNGIEGELQRLKDISEGTSTDYIHNISVSSKRLMDSINGIIDYSDLESGALELDLSVFNIAKRISRIPELIQGRIDAKRLELTLNIDASVPELIEGDEKRILRMIMNLLENSLKFTNDGVISITVVFAAGAGLEISVTDTGRGIHEDRLKQIFDAFEQCESDQSFTRYYEGLGLGLSITANLVQIMNGDIHVESEAGKGSAFTLRIPVKEAKKLTIPVTDRSNLNALIVEDNIVNTAVLKSYLKKLEIPSGVATDGEKGVAAFLTGDYNIIFMDVQMPVMNGLEATQRIRAAESNKSDHIPIIAVTANAKKQECMDAGMDGFIQKPVSIDGILDAIMAVIAK